MARTGAIVLLVALLAGCQGRTSVSTVWKSPDPLPPPFARVVTLVVNTTPAERRAAEDELAAQLKPGQGVAGHTLVSDEQLRDRDAVKQILQSQNIDGAVVLRLVDVDERTTYYPPTYRTTYSYRDYYDSFVTYNPGYSVTDRIVRAEVSVYAVREERLLWAGSSSTTNPANARDLARQIAEGAAAELRKQGMIR